MGIFPSNNKKDNFENDHPKIIKLKILKKLIFI